MCKHRQTQREKCVQQDIAVQSYLRFLDLITVLGMHSLKVECQRYTLLKTHDNSGALIKRLEINLSRKALECNQTRRLKKSRISHERFYTVDVATGD